MDYLQITGKKFLVTGVANKKSVAWLVARAIEALGGTVLYSVHSEERRELLEPLLRGKPVFVCDVAEEAGAQGLADAVSSAGHGVIHGLVHSIAFAKYRAGKQAFHETSREDFLQATTVSAFSLVELARAFKPLLAADASVVSVGISSQVTAVGYGCMSPVKAALESVTRFLAKSFSADTRVRFNTVNSGPLKTSASAGIPGYLESYLFAEKLTLRKRGLETREVADAVVWLLSPRSSGVNAQGIVVDAGMGWNYFDEEVVKAAMRIGV
ncbi:MAG: SDR family oxidoreductase [Puniceicoccales bacterium]|jgi:enoyl-[acyl-carrier protein] reductase I|nr:SDR family oxidoreductase [Puniceicoccales bacterium]